MFLSCCFLPDPSTPLPRSPGTPQSSNWPFRHSAGCSSPPRLALPSAPTCPGVRRPHGNGPRQRRRPWPQTALPRPTGRRTPPTKDSRFCLSALTQTFLGALEHESQTVEVVQATAAAQADAQTFQDKLPYHFPVPVGQFDAPRGGQLPHRLSPAAPRRGRGGIPRTARNQGCRTAFAEGGGPSANGVGVPFQGLGHRRTRPALGSSNRAYHPSRSRGVGDRIIRRRKSLASICHCSRNRSISLTPITTPFSLQDGLTQLPTTLPHASCAFHLALV